MTRENLANGPEGKDVFELIITGGAMFYPALGGGD